MSSGELDPASTNSLLRLPDDYSALKQVKTRQHLPQQAMTRTTSRCSPTASTAQLACCRRDLTQHVADACRSFADEINHQWNTGRTVTCRRGKIQTPKGDT